MGPPSPCPSPGGRGDAASAYGGRPSAVGGLLAALLALLLAACASDPLDDGVDAPRPQPGVDVRHVTAEVVLDPETLRLEATATLDVAHPDTLRALALGLDDALDVVAVRVDGAAVAAERAGDGLRVPLSGGQARSEVAVTYRGVPATGVFAGDAAGQRVVFTDGWPDRTAGWLPTVHHPSDPATLDLTLDVPAALDVVASGVAVADAVAGGRRRARFVLEEPAPPYTFAFAVADFVVTEQAGRVPVRHALLAADAGLAGRLARTPAVIDTLAALLGPYPYAAYATVQVPLAFAGMENAAAPFLQARLYGRALAGRNPVEEVNVHEVVHQWMGNAVVPADWRDLWVIEGAATYLTTVVYERLDGPEAARDHRTLMARSIAPADAARRLVPAAYADPSAILTPTVYQKAGSVYHLLRLTLGDDAFFGALRRIQTAFADRPLATVDFQAAMEAAGDRSLDRFFRTWVYGEGVPTLRVRWTPEAGALAWEITGDDGTLDGVPFELRVRQGDRVVYVAATEGVLSLPGDARPEVEPVGVLLAVER